MDKILNISYHIKTYMIKYILYSYMKYCKILENNINEEYREYYIDYNKLKNYYTISNYI